MPGTLDLGIAIARGGAAAPPTVNPNLLTKTEQFDAAAWTAIVSCSVAANATTDPLGGLTADTLTTPAVSNGLAQISATAAASGATINSSAGFLGEQVWERRFVSGSFDSTAYVFSVWLKGAIGASVRLQLGRSGGFLRCAMIDEDDGMTWSAWGAKLELGSTPTGTAADYGMVN